MVNGCLKNQKVDEYFSQSFLNNDLLKILPDGYDICYNIDSDDDILSVVFYLYDSEAPMNKIDSEYIIGSISSYIDKGEDLEINISSLSVNERLNGFNLRKAGFGTYLLLITISYAKSLDIENIKLDDMSDGYRTEHNIYKKIGLEYEDEDGGPEMIGYVDKVYSNIKPFLNKYSNKIINKLDELTEYFYDDEWDEEEEYRKRDYYDGECYTYDEFLDFYQGDDYEWEYNAYDDCDQNGGAPGPGPGPSPGPSPGPGQSQNDRVINARNRWLDDMRRRFQESVQSGQPDMELAQIIMRNTPIDQNQVRTIPMSNRERINRPTFTPLPQRVLPRQNIESNTTNTFFGHPIRQTNIVPSVRLVRPGEDISHLRMMHAELVPKKNSLDSPPDSPDRNRQRIEAARDIQRRFRGNRQRRKLTKNRPRYGKMQEPATEKEQIRRWIDLSNQFDPDDPVKGYLNPFTKKNSKKNYEKNTTKNNKKVVNLL